MTLLDLTYRARHFPATYILKSERGACATATSQEKKSKDTVHDSAEPEKIDRTAPAGPRKGRDVEPHRAANPQLEVALAQRTNRPVMRSLKLLATF